MKPKTPLDITDAHLYGGLVLLTIGAAWWLGAAPAMIVAGLGLWAIVLAARIRG